MESELRVVGVVRPLELGRGDVPQRRVPADAVVERLDVLEDARLRLLPAGVLLVMHQFPLQAGEEALDRRIVPAVTRATHARDQAMTRQQGSVLMAHVLSATIRMMQDRRSTSKPRQSDFVYAAHGLQVMNRPAGKIGRAHV